jgi:hypothetical protein
MTLQGWQEWPLDENKKIPPIFVDVEAAYLRLAMDVHGDFDCVYLCGSQMEEIGSHLRAFWINMNAFFRDTMCRTLRD